MQVSVLNAEGKETGRSVELNAEVFGMEPNEHALYLAVKSYLAAQRQGTHKAKERGEITGSTKKIKRQKGTGTARAGSIKNPLFRGGGRVFGPRPRNYTVRLNKKVKALARRSALSARAAEGSIRVIEDLSMDAPATKTLNNVLNAVNPNGGRQLLVTADNNKNVYLSGRNLQSTHIQSAKDLNTYNVLKAGTVLISESAVDIINKQF